MTTDFRRLGDIDCFLVVEDETLDIGGDPGDDLILKPVESTDAVGDDVPFLAREIPESIWRRAVRRTELLVIPGQSSSFSDR